MASEKPDVQLPTDAPAGAPQPQADSSAPPDGVFDLPEVDTAPAELSPHAIDLLGDVELDVKIELGRCQMLVGDVLALSPGSVVELDKLAGDPVDVYVNERLVARGEVLVVNDNFCVRINEIASADV